MTTTNQNEGATAEAMADTFHVAGEIMEQLTAIEPLVDAAKGFRARLETGGWTAESAEEIARCWLVEAIRSCFRLTSMSAKPTPAAS